MKIPWDNRGSVGSSFVVGVRALFVFKLPESCLDATHRVGQGNVVAGVRHLTTGRDTFDTWQATLPWDATTHGLAPEPPSWQAVVLDTMFIVSAKTGHTL